MTAPKLPPLTPLPEPSGRIRQGGGMTILAFLLVCLILSILLE
jgi:hypothetical protein